MPKTLKDLGLAMINATLILIVLCLFLAWKVTSKADQVASNFARNLVTIQPLREDIQGTTTELAALRQDLAQISRQSDGLQSASLQRIETQLGKITENVERARQSVAHLSQAPTRLVDHAIDTAADRLTQGISDFRGYVPPKS